MISLLHLMLHRVLGQRRFFRRGWRVVIQQTKRSSSFGGPISVVRARRLVGGRGFRADVYSDRLFLLDEQIVSGQYLQELHRLRPLLLERAQSGDVSVVDGGANVGLFSLFASVLLDGRVNVVGFEPLDENLHLLVRNWRQLEHRIHPLALSDREGTARLYLTSSTGSTLNRREADEFTRRFGTGEPYTVDVQTTRLDSIPLGIPRIDLLKLDVEGAEEAALAGARNSLVRDHPAIFCSYEHPSNDRNRLIDMLTAIGDYVVRDDSAQKLLTFEPRS